MATEPMICHFIVRFSTPLMFSPKIPVAMPPHTPHSPCTGNAPTGSSIFSLSKAMMPKTTRTPAMAPMAMASGFETTLQLAVMPTRPAKHAVESHRQIRLGEQHPTQNHRRDRTGGRRNRGVGGDQHGDIGVGLAGKRKLAAGVEAVPADPQARTRPAWPRSGCVPAGVGICRLPNIARYAARAESPRPRRQNLRRHAPPRNRRNHGSPPPPASRRPTSTSR